MSGSPVYLMVSRKRTITEIALWLLLFAIVLGAYQYTNYVSRQMCGVVALQDGIYKNTPPTMPTGKQMAIEFDKLSRKYKCK